jgi:hypothetical protein
MFKLDLWEELEANENYDKPTLAVAKELAFEMCSDIFERLGLSATTDESSLRVAGRGATFVFPLRGNNVPMKYAGRPGTSRAGTRRKRGCPSSSGE